MGIHVHQGDGFVTLERAQYRDWHAVVAAEGDQGGARRKNFAHRLFGPLVMFPGIRKIGSHVATVNYFDVATIEQWSTEVPVEVVAGVRRHMGALADGVRRATLVVGHLVRLIG